MVQTYSFLNIQNNNLEFPEIKTGALFNIFWTAVTCSDNSLFVLASYDRCTELCIIWVSHCADAFHRPVSLVKPSSYVRCGDCIGTCRGSGIGGIVWVCVVWAVF